MNTKHIIDILANALEGARSSRFAKSMERYFPEGISALGIPTAQIATLAGNTVRQHPTVCGGEWIAIADHFAGKGRPHEHMMLASSLLMWAQKRNSLAYPPFDAIEKWLENSVSNWAQCDDLCIKTLHVCLTKWPHLFDHVLTWDQSESVWCRRATNVACVKFVGTGRPALTQILQNCSRLLSDENEYVRKGVGWVLKVIGQHDPDELTRFLREHACRMDRATLRYATEKMTFQARQEILTMSRTTER